MYWGYTTRLASSINDVFDGCPHQGGYDLKIGTSKRGDKTVEEKTFKLPNYEAYRTGMGITICKGCKSKHLIAENLNETPGLDGDANIEDYFKTKGMEDSVRRVTPGVFNLEHIQRFDIG